MKTKTNKTKGQGKPELLAALKEHDTGRWQYNQIDCCLSGKDADLNSGYYGIQLQAVDEEFAYCVARMGKTVVGADVCLNHSEEDYEEYQKARESYIDAMYHYVCDCGYSGNWSGDDWFLDYDEEFKVPIGADAIKTAEAIVIEAEKVTAPFEKAMNHLELVGSQLSGWKDARGRRMKEGRMPKCAAWMS